MTIKSLTLDDINKAVVAAQYYVFPGTTMTVCCLTMQHGYTVIGKSACIDPDNFDEAIGRSLANQDAVQNVWELEAYLAMYKNAKGEDPVFSVSAINDPVPILTPDPVPVATDPPVSPPVDPAAPAVPVVVPPSAPLPADPPSDPAPPDSAPPADPAAPLPTDPTSAPAPDPAPVDPAPVDVAPPTDPVTPEPAPVADPAPVDPAPVADPAPVDPPVAVDPVPPVADSVPDPVPAPAPAPDVPKAMTADKPITSLTPDELVVEEQAVVKAEDDLTVGQAELAADVAAEDQREADWAAAHPANPAPPPSAPVDTPADPAAPADPVTPSA